MKKIGLESLDNSYHTPYQKIWELKSTLKTRKRRVINFNEKAPFFPEQKQPFLNDTRINYFTDEVRNKILLLSFYKHINDITNLEIKLINTTCNKILFDELKIKYDECIKINMLSVIIDEYYHAYLAKDIIMQIKKYYPDVGNYKIPVSDAYHALTSIRDDMDIKYRDMFQVIAICIFETTLVKELIHLFNTNEINSSIKLYIEDHINDEAKHCNFFMQLLSYSWKSMNDEYKNAIGDKLLFFIIQYFSVNSWREYNKDILFSFTQNETLSEEIISEFYDNFEVSPKIPVVNNLLNVLDKAGITKNIKFQSQLQKHYWYL